MFILAAGGTGGHIIPALAVAEALERKVPRSQIVFIGVGTEMEQKLIVPKYTLETVPYVPVLGKGVKGWLQAIQDFNPALREAMAIYRKYKPDVVIGFGGFPSVVPMVAAKMSNVPRMLHEQNVRVGLANKFTSLFANKIFAVPRAEGFWSKQEVTHLLNPVRDSFLKVPNWQQPSDGNPFLVLVVGGSQGAVAVNDAVLAQIDLFKKYNIAVTHVAGWKDYDRVLKAYAAANFERAAVHAFVDDLSVGYARAHLVVCRAGAMTVAEVSACGRPAIYIPLAIAGGHQAENIRHVVQNDAAEALAQGPDLAEKLGQAIEVMVGNPSRLARMGRNARNLSRGEDNKSSAERIAEAAFELAPAHTPVP